MLVWYATRVTISPERWLRRRRWTGAAAASLGAVGLFFAYVQMSRAIWVNSDGSSNALQAWDMLHGNVLLRGWTLTDVTFYTVELPIYALVEAVHGLDVDTVHIAAALIYTAVVVAACVLALARAGARTPASGRGRGRGRDSVARVGVVLFIMAVPQPGTATGILLGSPDHFGTSLALMLLFLLVDRRSGARLTPVWLGLGLAWTLISDTTALYLGVGPIALVHGWRALRARQPLGADARLVLASLAAYPVARLAEWGIHAAGGYQAYRPSTVLAPVGVWPSHAVQAGKSFLLLYGIDVSAPAHGWAVAGWVVRGVGVALVVWSLWLLVRRAPWARPVDVVLALALTVNLAAFTVSTMAGAGVLAREVSDTLPLGAVLAGRLAGPGLAAGFAKVWRRRVAGAGLGLAGLGAFGVGALFVNALAQPVTESSQLAVVGWLSQHGLTYGVGRYWDASVTTVRSGGRIVVRPVDLRGSLPQPPAWDYSGRWYGPADRADRADPADPSARFVLVDPFDPAGVTAAQARRVYGAPSAVFQVGGREVMVYRGGLRGSSR